jgi:hypothetical protein
MVLGTGKVCVGRGRRYNAAMDRTNHKDLISSCTNEGMDKQRLHDELLAAITSYGDEKETMGRYINTEVYNSYRLPEYQEADRKASELWSRIHDLLHQLTGENNASGTG